MNHLVDRLSSDLKPVRLAPAPGLVTAAWIFLSALFLGIWVAGFHRYRSDAGVLIHSFTFTGIFAALFLTSAVAGLLAVRSAIPGRDLSKGWLLVLFLFFVLALLPLFGRTLQESPAELLSGLSLKNGWHCGLSVMLYALLPATVLLWFFNKKLASTRPLLSGGLVGLSVGALGAAALAWVCPQDEAVHLLIWHILPVFVLSLIFAKLSRKFLSF
jgi:hypothetical protein